MTDYLVIMIDNVYLCCLALVYLTFKISAVVAQEVSSGGIMVTTSISPLIVPSVTPPIVPVLPSVAPGRTTVAINPARTSVGIMASPTNTGSCDRQCESVGSPVYILGATTGIFAVITAILLVMLVVLCKRRSHRVERKRSVAQEGVESRYWKDPLTLPPTSLETTLSEQKEPNVWFSLDTTDTFKEGAEDARGSGDQSHQPNVNQKAKHWYRPKRKAPLPPNVTRYKSKSGEVIYAVPNAQGTLSFFANHQYKELDLSKMKSPSEYTKPVLPKPRPPPPPRPLATDRTQAAMN